MSIYVQKFRTIYKKVGINVHNLLHLTDCVKTFGSVNTFSAYNFENHIYKISQLVRGKRLVIQQICNKLAAWHRLSLKFQLDQNRVHAHSFRNNDRDCYFELSQGRWERL